jgi:hypothetical protein
LVLSCEIAAADEGCMHANQKFSVGSTRCDCPSIKVESMDSTGEKGHVTSKHLSCAKDGTWVDAQATCVDMSGGFHTRSEFYRLSRMYCPLALNPEEVEKTFAEADSSNSIAAVKGVCKRLGSLAALQDDHRCSG